MSAAYQVIPVSAADCTLVDEPWGFAVDQAAAIDQHWRERQRRQPELFNGRVLVLREGAIETGAGEAVFRGRFIETDFAAFLAWRDRGFPPLGVRNCFAMAAIETADGAFVLGEMAPHTAPAGQIYFPSGTPDRSDVVAGRVDLDGSARRELREETGLGPEDVTYGPGLILVTNAARVCCMKRVRSSETAEGLVARIHGWLAQDSKPELARMHIVRTPADIVPAMPDFVVAYLKTMFASFRPG